MKDIKKEWIVTEYKEGELHISKSCIVNFLEKAEKHNDSKYLASELAKSMYKAVQKAIKSHKKNSAKKITDDILDPNYIAQVDPDEVPEEKTNVLYKRKSSKTGEKGVDKLKQFIDEKKSCSY